MSLWNTIVSKYQTLGIIRETGKGSSLMTQPITPQYQRQKYQHCWSNNPFVQQSISAFHIRFHLAPITLIDFSVSSFNLEKLYVREYEREWRCCYTGGKKWASLSGKFLFLIRIILDKWSFSSKAACTRVHSPAIESIECTNALWLFPNCVQFLSPPTPHQWVTRFEGPRMARFLSLHISKA